MKYTEEEYIEKVKLLYKGEFEVVGRFKGLTKPVLLKSKFGLLQPKTARQVLEKKPTIAVALNKTEYFLNTLKDKHPEIADELTAESEYINAKTPMLFNTKFGLVKTQPDKLLNGHKPNIRSAVNRKEYFYNQLKDIYSDYDYDFIVTSTDRHKGRVDLICPIHGVISIDSDWIFSGCGCPKCNTGWTKSNLFYFVELSNDIESFYKIGISYITDKDLVRRYKDYESLGYKIREISKKEYNSYEECLAVETKIRKLIKNNLYTPKIWPYKTSLECFKENLLDIILKEL